MGRVWESPVGNLYASGLVELRDSDPPAPTLALVAGVALYRSVGSIDVHLKWPNDLMLGDAKVAGILLEREARSVVIGIGVNLIEAPKLSARKTTTLAAQGLGVSIETIVNELEGTLAVWRTAGVAAICEAWLRAGHRVGTPLNAVMPDGKRLSGSFAGLTEEGALNLALPTGECRVIHAGDVFLI